MAQKQDWRRKNAVMMPFEPVDPEAGGNPKMTWRYLYQGPHFYLDSPNPTWIFGPGQIDKELGRNFFSSDAVDPQEEYVFDAEQPHPLGPWAITLIVLLAVIGAILLTLVVKATYVGYKNYKMKKATPSYGAATIR